MAISGGTFFAAFLSTCIRQTFRRRMKDVDYGSLTVETLDAQSNCIFGIVHKAVGYIRCFIFALNMACLSKIGC